MLDLFEDKGKLYKDIFDSLTIGVVVIGPDLRVIAFNKQMKVWFSKIRVGIPCHSALCCGSECDGIGCLIHQTFEDGETHEKKFRILDGDMPRVYRMIVSPMISSDGDLKAAVKVVEDVTELSNREAFDIQTLQLAAVGQLAAGIAHEFNNINAVIKGHIDLLLLDDSLPKDTLGQIKVVRDVVKQGVDITRNMLLFARDHKGRSVGAFINDIIKDVLSIISNDLKSEGVFLEFQFGENIKVWANVSQIGQVLINLIMNARHAMMDNEEKCLKIKTWSHEKMAYISIEDNGCGIVQEDQEKLFSPFFTTKGEHAVAGSSMVRVKGTGLGLSICHTIIEKNHGGKIFVESEVGNGSSFTISIPLFDGPVELKKSTVCLKNVELAKGERILVVDDDPRVLSVVERVLSLYGYSVDCITDGFDALRAFNERPYDVVVTDIKMPGLSGWELIEYLNQVEERPVIVVITGGDYENEVYLTKADAFLTKPFSFEEFLFVIERGLKSRR